MKTTAKLTSGAMDVSIAKEGQRTVNAPLGHALVELAQADPRVVGLSADLAKYTDLHILRDAMPERFFQIGMAEQALLGAAAGLAMEGAVPFASTYSVFATRRAYDFLLLDIAEPRLNVNMVCALPGLTTGYGPSHQATEDIAILRAIPGLVIVDPCDATDIQQAVPQLATHDGPTYTRILRGKVPAVLDEYDYEFELGRAKLLRDGSDVLIVSSGLMTENALEAAKLLADDHVDVAVLHSPTLKPFDSETVLKEIGKDRLVVTAENHSIIGGLFDSVAHELALSGVGKKVTPVSLPDEFLDAGALPTLYDRYGLSTAKIVSQIKGLL
ncbi:transketolase family protein [Brevibacterium oceani]|uniref:transketolase family protein n=1 Tax=Brevibacterium oceani TaxID=358099 RepID=UPI001B320BE9|nr:transketolase C-terminal domain-containing protein [Brevibacterium oceani]